MNIRRNLIWICAGPLIASGLVALAVLNPNGSDYVTIGCIFGTLFGHTTLAAAWTAFGPLPFLWRLPLSLLWLLGLTVALACNLKFHSSGPDETIVVVGASLAAQFIFLQIPFWGLALRYGLRLRRSESTLLGPDQRESQFGIRQLMVVTTIIAVVLGAARLAIPHLSTSSDLHEGMVFFVFLAAAAVVVTLPLILAALLPRLALPAVAVVLMLAGLLTAWEVPLLSRIQGGRSAGPDTLHIVFINGFTSAWVLAIVLIVRISGYRFGTSRAGGGAK